MAYLKYYQQENVRHAVSKEISVDFKTAKAMTLDLCKIYNLPKLEVRLSSRRGRGRSWFGTRQGKPLIVLHRKMLNPLTMAHEFAHYRHQLAHNERCRKAGKLVKVRWHNKEHQKYTDEAVGVIKEHETYGRLFLSRLEKIKKAVASVQPCGFCGKKMLSGDCCLQQTVFKALPAMMDCPKCKGLACQGELRSSCNET